MVEGGREGVRGTEVDNVEEEDEVDKVATWEGEMEG